ncbi:MAG: GTPase ObgE [Verrucomicrobiota bacterium]|nr:GTPase ObgE [Verrucomicrobiota bacterium]
MFVDKAFIQARAGRGGDGCVSFRREKYVPNGGPDGGDGGNGGSIILKVDSSVNNLVDLKFQPIRVADNGAHGKGKKCHGKNAKDYILKVPQGTVIYRIKDNSKSLITQKVRATREEGPFIKVRPDKAETELVPLETILDDEYIPHDFSGELHFDRHMVSFKDLTELGEEYVLSKGGRGGRGNTHWKSSKHQAPREFEYGRDGEAGDYWLVLKMIADVGLVGYPNAGKSTLLSKISNAHPKIGPYPFTTLNPVIGAIDKPDGKKILVADIPGLIEGAHENVGLGHEFLRHIERCKVFVYVVDMSGSEGRNPYEDFCSVRKEIKLYNPSLTKSPAFIAANKMDLPEAEGFLKEFKRHCRLKIIPISAQMNEGVDLIQKEILAFFK